MATVSSCGGHDHDAGPWLAAVGAALVLVLVTILLMRLYPHVVSLVTPRLMVVYPHG